MISAESATDEQGGQRSSDDRLANAAPHHVTERRDAQLVEIREARGDRNPPAS